MSEAHRLVELLQEFISAYGPIGQEGAVRELCLREFEPLCDEVSVDAAGNVIAKISGRHPELPALRVLAHMDELSMIVKKVKDDGSLRVEPLGGLWFGNFGQGAVGILGDRDTLPGILSYGSMHITSETAGGNRVRPTGGLKGHKWEDAFVITRLSKDDLKARGVHAGTRVVVADSRRQLTRVQDCVGGHFMDDRAGIIVMLEAARQLQAAARIPARDVYLIATVAEEIGGHGAAFASASLPGDVSLAIDVAPVAEEYDIQLNAQPVIVWKDGASLYDTPLANRLLALGLDQGLDPQCAVLSSYGSDSSISRRAGHAARAVLIGMPTENTHGLETIEVQSLENCATLLAAFIDDDQWK